MRPSVATNRMARGRDLLEYLRMPERVLADGKERGLGAVLGKGSEDGASVFGPRAVVKRQHYFLQDQEVVQLILFEAKTRAARGVNLHRTGNAQRIGVRALDDPLGLSRDNTAQWLRAELRLTLLFA